MTFSDLALGYLFLSPHAGKTGSPGTDVIRQHRVTVICMLVAGRGNFAEKKVNASDRAHLFNDGQSPHGHDFHRPLFDCSTLDCARAPLLYGSS